GTDPANVTVPLAAACTGVPGAAPTAIPRCCPPAYGCAASKTKPRSTGPSAGQVQARAPGTTTSSTRTSTNGMRRTATTALLSEWKTAGAATVAASPAVVKSDYSEPR